MKDFHEGKKVRRMCFLCEIPHFLGEVRRSIPYRQITNKNKFVFRDTNDKSNQILKLGNGF